MDDVQTKDWTGSLLRHLPSAGAARSDRSGQNLFSVEYRSLPEISIYIYPVSLVSIWYISSSSLTSFFSAAHPLQSTRSSFIFYSTNMLCPLQFLLCSLLYYGFYEFSHFLHCILKLYLLSILPWVRCNFCGYVLVMS